MVTSDFEKGLSNENEKMNMRILRIVRGVRIWILLLVTIESLRWLPNTTKSACERLYCVILLK